jgi:hypothetical protein
MRADVSLTCVSSLLQASFCAVAELVFDLNSFDGNIAVNSEVVAFSPVSLVSFDCCSSVDYYCDVSGRCFEGKACGLSFGKERILTKENESRRACPTSNHTLLVTNLLYISRMRSLSAKHQFSQLVSING